MVDVDITIPPPEYRMTSAQAAVWQLTGMFIKDLLATYADRQAMYSALLSRVTREMRRELGPDGAAKILHRMADQQREMVKYDRP